MLFVICEDVELCPRPEVMTEFISTQGLEIVHQNIRVLLKNIGSLTLFLDR